MPKKQVVNEGKFSQEEVELFNEGLRLYGKDFQKVADHIGTRSVQQVRAKCNYNMSKEGVLFSPTGKKKRSAVDDDSKTPMKKAKPTPVTSSAMATAKSTPARKKAPAPAPAAKPRTASRSAKKEEEEAPASFSRKKAAIAQPSSDDHDEEDEKLEKAKEVAPAADAAVTTMIPPKVAEIVKREEVQAVLAGFAGFLVAFIVKKFLLS
jgi:hypothetical protein